MRDDKSHWEYTNIKWSNAWTEVFGVGAEVKVNARRFDRTFSSKEVEKLLRKTEDGTWERDWMQWQYAVALVAEGKDVRGAKILKNITAKPSPKVSKNLLWVTAARILYQNGFLTESIRYYQKVKKSSDYWYEAQEEMGWAHLRKGQPQNTLAVTQSLLVDSLSADIGPFPFYQAALSDLKICSYTDVSKTLEKFKSRFSKKAVALMALRDQVDIPPAQKLVKELQKKRVTMTKMTNIYSICHKEVTDFHRKPRQQEFFTPNLCPKERPLLAFRARWRSLITKLRREPQRAAPPLYQGLKLLLWMNLMRSRVSFRRCRS